MIRLLIVTLAAALVSCSAPATEPLGYSLTVYSSAAPGSISIANLAGYGGNLPGYALVRDTRRMMLPTGVGEVRFTDVPTRMDPTTVAFDALTDPAGTRVIEQNYQYDLVDNAKLLQRFVGRPITVEQARGDKIELLTGTLLSASGSLILQRDGGEVLTLKDYGNIRFPALPGGLITKPTLVWKIDSHAGGQQTARVSYQVQGLVWWSDYNLTLRDQGGHCDLDLSAWVTLVNQSGGSYPDARLKLVAGDVHRAPVAAPRSTDYLAMVARSPASATVGFNESTLSEYHLYALDRRTDLPANSTKQLELFPTVKDVRCRKELVFQPDQDEAQKSASAYVIFDNGKANHLGMPLPGGRMRVNQVNASDGALEFIGEDVIRHTPRNETVRIKLGESFDVVGERKVTDQKTDGNGRRSQASVEVRVRNRGDHAVKVLVRESLLAHAEWQIVANNHSYAKLNASTVELPVDIPANGEAKVAYTAVYRY
jgi:hypothetical protein